MSVWFVSGSSRGFGLEIVRAALEAGHSVVATARDARTVRGKLPQAGEALLTVPLDVTDAAGIQTAVDAAIDRFGQVDVLVNNAGSGLPAAVEEADDDAVRNAATSLNHTQPGDPAKAAQAIVDVASAPQPPLRLQLGTDILQAFETKLDSFRKEMGA
ncbi:SDR family NAD(P)-dependent oxidoreductase [Streptomyces sp. NPDC101234]|uniref:SDR family NAD(P)-dependent oxidoreductase n=1 Tax=Streptomyces sp. NPDC101234 TaxID=3366138 RepID=UPI00380FCF7E